MSFTKFAGFSIFSKHTTVTPHPELDSELLSEFSIFAPDPLLPRVVLLYITNCYNHVASFCEGSVCKCVHRWCNMVGVLHRWDVTPLGCYISDGEKV